PAFLVGKRRLAGAGDQYAIALPGRHGFDRTRENGAKVPHRPRTGVAVALDELAEAGDLQRRRRRGAERAADRVEPGGHYGLFLGKPRAPSAASFASGHVAQGEVAEDRV